MSKLSYYDLLTNALRISVNMTLRVCLGFAYFIETENFFAKSTVVKGKS